VRADAKAGQGVCARETAVDVTVRAGEFAALVDVDEQVSDCVAAMRYDE
jgi:hypothetical protein